jgi:hypothetical protein
LADQKISALNNLAAATSDDYLVIVNDPTGTAETMRITVGNFMASATLGGFLPVGAYIPMAIGIAGADTHANLVAKGFARCDGTTPAAQGVVSPTISATMPNISAGAFIRGNSVAWTSGAASGGADTVTIGANNLPVHTHADTFALGGTTSFGSATHTHTGPSHTHTGPSHTHAAGTLAGPSHTHTSAAHTHAFTTGASGTGATGSSGTASTGAGSSHSHGAGTLQFYTAYYDNDTGRVGFYLSGGTIEYVFQRSTYGETVSNACNIIVAGGSVQYYTSNGAGSTGSESSHTHAGPSHTHTGPSHTHTGTSDSTTPGATGSGGTGAVTGSTAAEGTGATGADGTGATGVPSATATVTLSGAVGNNTTTGTAIATLPVYFNAVFYMRVR